MHVSTTDQKDDKEIVGAGLLTIREAAEFLSLSRSKLYELMDAGRLHFVRIDGARRIPKQSLIDLAAQGLQGGTRASESAPER